MGSLTRLPRRADLRSAIAVRTRIRALAEDAALWSREVRAARVAVVLVGWDGERAAGAAAALTGGIRGSRALRGATLTVVDNSGTLGPLRGATVVAGSNSTGEFSGYDEGVAAVLAAGPAPDVWVFANDRFASYEDGHLRRLTAAVLDEARHHPLLTGRVDVLPEPLDLRGQRFRTYCRSNLMVVSGELLRAVGPVTTLTSAGFDAVVPAGWPGSAAAARDALAAWSGRGWADFVLSWLTGWPVDGVAAGIAGGWYRAAPLTAASWPTVRLKIVAIANEHSFSTRCAAAGSPPIELTALALAAALPPADRGRRVGALTADPLGGAAVRTDRRHRDAVTGDVLRARVAAAAGHRRAGV